MTLEEIKNKYAEQVRARRARLDYLNAKVNVQRAKLEWLEKEFNEYAEAHMGEVSAEKQKAFEYYHRERNEMRAELDRRKDELMRAEYGDDVAERIVNNMNI